MSEQEQAVRINYRAWETNPLTAFDIPVGELLEHLVGWAILAPNSHNVQPWRFMVNATSSAIQICADPQFVLPASDKLGRQAYISIGCALENLICAAGSYGLDFNVEYLLGYPVYPEPIVNVRVIVTEKCGKSINREMFELMKSRRMNRSKHDPAREIPQLLLDEARNFAETSGLVLDSLTDTATRFAIAEAQYLADRTVILRNDFRNELARFLLPNNTELPRGMPGHTFGLNDKMALRVHEELKKSGPFDPDLAYGFAVSGRDGLRSSPAIIVISVKEDAPPWWVMAGRALQRIALLAEKNGIGLAVHAALVEVEMFNKMLKLRLRREERPTVLCRIGYTIEERLHSPRTAVHDILEPSQV